MSFDEKLSKTQPHHSDIIEGTEEKRNTEVNRAPVNPESSVSRRKVPRTTTTGGDFSQKDNTISSQLLTSQNVSKQPARKKNQSKVLSEDAIEADVSKTKGLFEEYQERWEKNNKRIFRFLITWKVGDNGKIEDQLKLMMNYLSIIFVIVIAICGFATTYYFHFTNKSNISDSITNQAEKILMSGLDQYYNSTEYMFQGYEFVLDYLNDVITSKLEINYKIYNFNEIRQFPYKGPNRLHQKGDTNRADCTIFSGSTIKFDNEISMTCLDWYEFSPTTLPTVHDDVYQVDIPQAKLHGAMDILNYILEPQLFDVFVTKIFAIYFGFETRQAIYYFPGLGLEVIPNSYDLRKSGWYGNPKALHLKQSDNSTYRVFSKPYYDAASKQRIITVSKVMLAPNIHDTVKRYQFGKGRMLGVANVDIKISEFQTLFDDIVIYDTGYILIVSIQGNLVNEPALFVEQIGMTGQEYTELQITQLISQENWVKIQNSTEKLLMTIETLKGLKIVIASVINSEHFYQGESVVIIFVIPWEEVYGAIHSQNTVNLNRLMISSFSSLSGFLIATILCTIYVKKKIVQMVSAISELNQNALKLSGNNNNNDSSTHSKKEVMEKLNEIQQNSQSQTIKDLVKGFENQLKGISKLGKGGENILKNNRNGLKYDSAQYCGTQLPEYVEPLLTYIDEKKETLDIDDHNENFDSTGQGYNSEIIKQQQQTSKQQSQHSSTAGKYESNVQTLLSHQNKKDKKIKKNFPIQDFVVENTNINNNIAEISFDEKSNQNLSQSREKPNQNNNDSLLSISKIQGQDRTIQLDDIEFNKSFRDNIIKDADQSHLEADTSTNNVIQHTNNNDFQNTSYHSYRSQINSKNQSKTHQSKQNNSKISSNKQETKKNSSNMQLQRQARVEEININTGQYFQPSIHSLPLVQDNNLTPHEYPDNQPYLPKNYTLQDSEGSQEDDDEE